MENVFKYVNWTCSCFCYDDNVIQLRQPLSQSVCLAIDNNAKNAASGAGGCWRPTSVMEPLSLEHAMWALQHSGVYEGTVAFWNVDSFATKAFGIDLNLNDPSWTQSHILETHWYTSSLASSHKF